MFVALFGIAIVTMQTGDASPSRIVLTISNRCTMRAEGAMIPVGELKIRANGWTRDHREVELRQGTRVSADCLNDVIATLKDADTGIFIRGAARRSNDK